MSTAAKMKGAARSRRSGYLVQRTVAERRVGTSAAFISERALDESLEDARLNAIADERAGGPFVRVSLDDL